MDRASYDGTKKQVVVGSCLAASTLITRWWREGGSGHFEEEDQVVEVV